MKRRRIYKTYSVFNVVENRYLHISATSKAHVRTYLKETGLRYECFDVINILHNGAESTPIENKYPQWFGLTGTNIDF